MKRLSKNCMVTTNLDAMKYGWTFNQQIRKNPEARRVYPDVRADLATRAKHKRVNQHLARYRKDKKLRHIKRAGYLLTKMGEKDD